MTTRRAAVLGSPIAHSRSPILHRAAYAELGLDWSYDAIDVTPEGLADFMAGCAWPEWAGLSLTMPLKADVLPLLADVSDLALQVRAANTVVFTDIGPIGANTDVAGMQRALEQAAGERLRVPSGAIIGSGATARSALAALAGMGARRIDLIARHAGRAAALNPLAEDLGVELVHVPWTDGSELAADAVIATVPPGAADDLVSRVPRQPGVLLDVAYGQGATPLTTAWRTAGGAVADGLDLLLWQAADQVQLMTGLEAPVEAMRAALSDESGR
jgi:shikimate dehydrogenase